MRRDYRQELTDTIIHSLENGNAPWQKPWNGSEPLMPFNPASGAPYRGGNVITLLTYGYEDPRWCTYKQAEAMGWQVRKGEKATLIEFWKFHDEIEQQDEQTGQNTRLRVALERPVVRYANVFNVVQMDNVPAQERTQLVFPWIPSETAEHILAQSAVPVWHDQTDKAFYSITQDQIHLPPKEAFADPARYYSTALHELGHATGHSSRLNRPMDNAFGSTAYAKEELRAEMASLFLSYRLGIPFAIDQHAAYVGSWITLLKNDKNELFRAARDAEQITEYLISLGQEQVQTHVVTHKRQSVQVQGTEKRPPKFPTSEKFLVNPSATRINLNVPFEEKEEVKRLGARWDKQHKTWYIPCSMDRTPFEQWIDTPRELSPSDFRQQFHTALLEAGLVVDGNPAMDGKWHHTTVSTSSKAKALKGAYIAHFDNLAIGEHPNGFIQNFDTGYSAPWRPQGLILNDEQRRQFLEQASENRRIREQVLATEREAVAQQIAKKWTSLPELQEHPYLARKQVSAFGLKLQGENLVTPVRDVNGKIWSLQYIPADPTKSKLFEKGGHKTGNFHVLGDLATADIVLFGEGYATCASLHMATGLPVVEVFDSGNIAPVLAALTPSLEGKIKLVCADDDQLTPERIRKILNKLIASEHNKPKLQLTNINLQEIILDGNPYVLASNAKCFIKLEQENGKDGVPRIVGEFFNEETKQRVPVLINNVGREKALSAANLHKVQVVIPVFSSLDGSPSDFNDLHVREGLDRVKQQLQLTIQQICRVNQTSEQLAKATLGDDAVLIAPKTNSHYVGKVLGNTENHTVQDLGRKTAVAHNMGKLNRVPVVGQTARITYQEGFGTVQEPRFEQRQSTVQQR